MLKNIGRVAWGFSKQIILISFVLYTGFQEIHCLSGNQAIGYNLNEQMATNKLLSCDFEIYGKVQGVFFRKFTETEAKKLGVHGWIMNTHQGTVKGQIEGPDTAVNEMKNWLITTGSPKSHIERAVFSEMKPISNYNFENFFIKR